MVLYIENYGYRWVTSHQRLYVWAYARYNIPNKVITMRPSPWYTETNTIWCG